jgi:hypothetical protein
MPPLPPSPAATAATGCRCCRYRLLQPRHSRRHRLPQPPPAAAATITGRRSRSHQPLQQRHSRSRADADTTAGRRQHRRRLTPTLASPDAAATRITARPLLGFHLLRQHRYRTRRHRRHRRPQSQTRRPHQGCQGSRGEGGCCTPPCPGRTHPPGGGGAGS